jgi:hypothetical protein
MAHKPAFPARYEFKLFFGLLLFLQKRKETKKYEV